MKTYQTSQIRNIALLGNTGSGKTAIYLCPIERRLKECFNELMRFSVELMNSEN